MSRAIAQQVAVVDEGAAEGHMIEAESPSHPMRPPGETFIDLSLGVCATSVELETDRGEENATVEESSRETGCSSGEDESDQSIFELFAGDLLLFRQRRDSSLPGAIASGCAPSLGRDERERSGDFVHCLEPHFSGAHAVDRRGEDSAGVSRPLPQRIQPFVRS